MTLKSIIVVAREFVAGVRAIPSVCSIAKDSFSAEDAYCERDSWKSENKRLCNELSSERAARQKAEADSSRLKEELDSQARLNLRIGLELNATKEQLTSALETIDALTRWRMQSEEPCPLTGNPGIRVFWTKDEGRNVVRASVYEVDTMTHWRHTPESWEAARKAGVAQ
jgi:hypothetical protein